MIRTKISPLILAALLVTNLIPAFGSAQSNIEAQRSTTEASME